jgi:nascent polypeptide-associated complex subunit alpha
MMRGNREMRRMLDKMGLDMKTMENVEEVIIKTETKELYLIKPQVIEMKGKDSTIFQVVASDIEEKQREVPSFKEEDVILVMQQANVSREKAIQALTESKGDMAQAILSLAIYHLVLISLFTTFDFRYLGKRKGCAH